MKVSEITTKTLKTYLRIDNDIFNDELDIYLKSAINYVCEYTGLVQNDEKKELDEHEDITTAILVIVSDFYENHLYHQSGVGTEVKTNRVVDTILNHHRINLV